MGFPLSLLKLTSVILLIACIFLLSFPFQTVTSANETLRKRVESVVDMALTTVSSLSEMYSGSASAANDVVTKPTEKTPDASMSEVERG